jgi:MscS family membrane protein
LVAAVLGCVQVLAQPRPGSPPAPSAPAPPPPDALGRETPRGTVLGFIAAARRGNDEATPLYLDTALKGQSAVELAHKLFVVLDNRLPARLNELSDKPEGGQPNPLKADQDVVGTIATAKGPLEITVERVNRGTAGRLWLFSRKTLESIPDVYDEIDVVSIDRYVPGLLGKPKILGVRLFEWLVLLFLVPLVYKAFGVLNRPLRPVLALWHRRYGVASHPVPEHLPGFIRLLVLAVTIRWIFSSLELPLLERQFWAGVSALISIAALVWMFLLVNASVESYMRRHAGGSARAELTPLLRLARRVADGLVISIGGLVALRYFGFDPTAALAGLGIGGIAVALAAQKTLENVVGGVSLVFDKAVQVGDTLKLNEMSGTVDFIGLRSTRIRTPDRTIITVPNGQMAAANIETLSARDKFWFHHFVGLTYETTSAQMRAVIDGIEGLLNSHPSVDRSSVRARFLRLGAFSLDIEIFAYVFAADWNSYLAVQQELLLRIMEIVEQSGTAIAFPSQTLHLADASSAETFEHVRAPATKRPVA